LVDSLLLFLLQCPNTLAQIIDYRLVGILGLLLTA